MICLFFSCQNIFQILLQASIIDNKIQNKKKEYYLTIGQGSKSEKIKIIKERKERLVN